MKACKWNRTTISALRVRGSTIELCRHIRMTETANVWITVRVHWYSANFASLPAALDRCMDPFISAGFVIILRLFSHEAPTTQSVAIQSQRITYVPWSTHLKNY